MYPANDRLIIDRWVCISFFRLPNYTEVYRILYFYYIFIVCHWILYLSSRSSKWSRKRLSDCNTVYHSAFAEATAGHNCIMTLWVSIEYDCGSRLIGWKNYLKMSEGRSCMRLLAQAPPILAPPTKKSVAPCRVAPRSSGSTIYY